jgi:AraC family transcriptional regulator of adaptative response/methylated-DNA-[protein]-cysteine methyltransferase
MIGMNTLKVNLRVAAPEELKAGGAGWVITAGFARTIFGMILIAEGPYGICHLSFARQGMLQEINGLKAQWASAELVRNDKRAGEWCRKIFSGGSVSCDGMQNPRSLHLYVKGSDFQVKTWQALLGIPIGTTVSYGQLAAMIGHPKAYRAVGGAVGRNPAAYLIPCHRVICSDGTFGGYRWGVRRKQTLLLHEREIGRSIC